MKVTENDRKAFAFAELVRKQANRIAALCAVNPDKAALEALNLCSLAADRKREIIEVQGAEEFQPEGFREGGGAGAGS